MKDQNQIEHFFAVLAFLVLTFLSDILSFLIYHKSLQSPGELTDLTQRLSMRNFDIFRYLNYVDIPYCYKDGYRFL